MTRKKTERGKVFQKKGFGLKTNLAIGQLVEFKSDKKTKHRGIIKCIHPFGKIGTVLVHEFDGTDAYIVPVPKVEFV